MPRRCVVPMCTSNYDSEKSHTTTFKFPNETSLREKWLKCINRKDYVPGTQAAVCIIHFEEEFIIREERFTRDDGSEIVEKRKKLALKKEAFPSIFPQQPHYLNQKVPCKRKCPEARREALQERDDETFKKWMNEDEIHSFKDVQTGIKERLESSWFYHESDNCITIFQIEVENEPKIAISFKIMDNLTVAAFKGELKINNSLRFILGKEDKLDRWTKFDNILSFLSSFDATNLTHEQSIEISVSFLKNISAKIDDEAVNRKLAFIIEQLSLAAMKQKRYSPDMLFWACKLYYSFPAAYSMLKECATITMPNISYLRKLATSLSFQSGKDYVNQHINYLKKKCNILEEHEKKVNVLLDEIYVTPSISYKGGNIVGISDNTAGEASTVQTFMISSLYSKNKDVVAVIPVKNLTAEQLHSYTLRVLHVLKECGYSVLTLLSDNNRINRNMFSLMCGGNLKPCVDNPVDEGKKLFFLFDTCHLIKSVRNNWLNQSATNQSFFYPDPHNLKQINIASLLHVKQIYDSEKHLSVKQAPKLNRKVLFPTSTERQNVKHALNLFHESTTVALEVNVKKFGNDFLQTKIFMSYISNWWRIVNCKHPLKGKHLRDPFSDPITSIDHTNVIFLKHFSEWLQTWQKLSDLPVKTKIELRVPEKGGMLSKETHFALKHTTDTMLSLIEYIFENLAPVYILLGKFQTDNLEAQFGQYRQMSGGNYSIAFRQILESQKKLQVLELIKLCSKKLGHFTIKLLDVGEFIDTDIESCEFSDEPGDFSEVLYMNENVEIAKNTMSVLIYIAGYVAYKVKRNILCLKCKLIVSCGKTLEFECPDDVSEYLKLSSRGGLEWPQEFTLLIVTNTYKTFEILISEQYEDLFLNHGYQKKLLMNLTNDRIHLMNAIPVNVCTCGQSSDILLNKCLPIACNIFLNNYSKVRNEKIAANKIKGKVARKLSTVKKI